MSEQEYLRLVERLANELVRAFNNSLDYNAWDKALDALEAVLRNKNETS
jgi:hypothetical protein